MKFHTLLFSCLVYTSTVFAQIPDYVPHAGLVAWYPFSGNTIDSSGNSNNGTAYGCTLTTDRYGRPNSAYYFDGISNYINISSSPSLDINSDITVSAWVKASSYSPVSGISDVVWRGNAVSAHDPYAIYLNGGELKFRRDVNTGTTVDEVGFTSSIVDTAFFHLLVGTYDSHTGYLSIYFDGNLTSQSYLPDVVSYATSSFWNVIGSVDIATTSFFQGTIDDVGIWDRALTPCEVSKLYFSSTTLITRQTLYDSVSLGSMTTLAISDTGGLATYQWQIDSGASYSDIPNSAPFFGANTRELTINPTNRVLLACSYRCIRNGEYCTDTSKPIFLYRNTLTTPCIAIPTDAVNIFPNPTRGSFSISADLSNTAEMKIYFYNITGELLFKDVIAASNGKFEKNYQNVLTTPGTYFLKFISSQFTITKKVVVD
jgi:Concanavalin A-like lectin/glucanases superfamily/Secretion system C-terminal sorting domain